MPELTSFVKDPEATLDYLWDWTSWLGADDTITGHVVTVDPAPALVPTAADLTVDSSTVDVDSKKVTVWLTGGTPGVRYGVTVSILTAGGRADDRTSRIHVQHR